METLDRILTPFEWIRKVLSIEGEDFLGFLCCLVVFSACLLLGGIAWNLAFMRAARAVRNSAKRLAEGATIEDLARIESSSAHLEAAFHWIAIRVVRASYSELKQGERLPQKGETTTVSKVTTGILRGVWLVLWGVSALLWTAPFVFLSGLGLAVLIPAVFTAYPSSVRSVVQFIVSNFSVSVVPVATLVASVPVLLLVFRLLISERIRARRSFRNEIQVESLEKLERASKAIDILAEVMRNQMQESVRKFSIEKYSAQEWFDRAESKLNRQSWEPRTIDRHIECNKECMDERFKSSQLHLDYSNVAKQAIREIEEVWNSELKEVFRVLMQVTTPRARAGLLYLRSRFSPYGTFYGGFIANNRWYKRRIDWQHQNLVFANPAADDLSQGREVIVRNIPAPERQWLEDELKEDIWDLAEGTRSLSALGDFARRLTASTKIDLVSRMAEN